MSSRWREGWSNPEPFRGIAGKPRQDCLANHPVGRMLLEDDGTLG